MAENDIDVSFVMTVYNKEYYLPAVLKALFGQQGLKNPEFIFVDDVSKDKSVQIIKEASQGIPNVTIVEKDQNEGISKSINRGIALAKGKWIRMLDSDDILPLDSTKIMLSLADKHGADMVYGKFTKTGKEPMDISAELVSGNIDYKYHPDALRRVLKGGFTRMGQLIKADALKKGKGADPLVFIQDESIPLRAANHAKGAIKMQNNVVLVPKETNNLSKNTVQLDNDRFFANYNFLVEEGDRLDKDIRKQLNIKAVSANWKYVKKNLPLAYLRPDFWVYILSKMFSPAPNFKRLKRYAKRFAFLSGVLRTADMKELSQTSNKYF